MRFKCLRICIRSCSYRIYLFKVKCTRYSNLTLNIILDIDIFILLISCISIIIICVYNVNVQIEILVLLLQYYTFTMAVASNVHAVIEPRTINYILQVVGPDMTMSSIHRNTLVQVQDRMYVLLLVFLVHANTRIHQYEAIKRSVRDQGQL